MEKYISTHRHRQSSVNHGIFLAETQSDRARLIYSAAFRRLQQKAQVFSLESNSAVRSRLTHSIEVSHIGRYIVAAICDKLSKSENVECKDYWMKNHLPIANMVEISCLAHDIGNPPFGHFGEAAIKEWAKSEEIKKSVYKALGENESEGTRNIDIIINDFVMFDGNPQGFRILTKLQGDDGLNGLNLTYSQLASFLKYVYCPADRPVNDTESYPFSKKNGFFDTEKEVVYKAWDSLGMPYNKRHPLSFLMEASDDISYCISDIEDGIEKKIINKEDFFKFVISRIESLKSDFKDNEEQCEKFIAILQESNTDIPTSTFLYFKTSLSNFLVSEVANKFIENYDSYMSLSINHTLICKGTFEHGLLKILKDFTSQYLFTSYEAEKMELSGFSIIKGILDEYLKILSLPKDKFIALVKKDSDLINENHLHIERRLYNRLPEKHINAYKTAVAGISLKDKNWTEDIFSEKYNDISLDKELNLRIHLIVDFVSGMTDQYSMDIYHLLKGINIK